MTAAFPPSEGVAALAREEQLRWFLGQWLERFSGCPAILQRTCCLSFMSAWVEVVAPSWSRLSAPGMGVKSGVESEVSSRGRFAQALALCVEAHNVSVDDWAAFFPVQEVMSPVIGDIGWLEFPCGGKKEWLGVCGIFGGWAPEGSDTAKDEFWWSVGSPADCSPRPVEAERLATRPRMFRPGAEIVPRLSAAVEGFGASEGQRLMIACGSGNRLTLV